MRSIAIATLVLLAACQPPTGNQAGNKTANNIAANMTAATATRPMSRQAALKLMHDRHENMEKIGDATKKVSRTLKSDSPDLAIIREASGTYMRSAPQVPSWFPQGTGPDVGKTYAKAEIWRKPEDFAAKANDFHSAARAFDAAAKAGDLNAIRARFGDLGKSCKACHEPYRAEHEH